VEFNPYILKFSTEEFQETSVFQERNEDVSASDSTSIEDQQSRLLKASASDIFQFHVNPHAAGTQNLLMLMQGGPQIFLEFESSAARFYEPVMF
jgi:hypothetical protein